ALEAAGISPRTPDPPGGSLDRDTDGRPTGVLRETAVNLVTEALRHLVPPVTPQRLGEALRGLPALGLTGVGAIASLDAGCWAGTGSELDILCEVGGDLPAKLSVLVQASTPHELETAAERVEAAGRHFRFLGLKAFSDGSLGGHTAAMRTPYHDRPDTTGTHRLDPGWAHEMSQAALSLGGRVAVHAIGDAANSRVLDLFERVIADGGDPARLRVEHASVLTDEDVDRLAATGATASVQPAFLASEIGWLEKRVGPERINQTYPFRTLRDRGVPLAGGSDCPVEPPHPLWGMAAARDRAGIVPEQGLDPADALALFTDGAARAIGEDASLMVGSAADVVVLDRDPVEASPNELREAEVIATWVNGEAVELLPQAWVA
ncbi:MAG: amidohydrolase, partial [Acidimicrobiia bacterium]